MLQENQRTTGNFQVKRAILSYLDGGVRVVGVLLSEVQVDGVVYVLNHGTGRYLMTSPITSILKVRDHNDGSMTIDFATANSKYRLEVIDNDSKLAW